MSGRARPSTSKWLTIDTRFRRFHKRSDAKEAPRRIWGTCPHRRRIACPLSRARPFSSLVHRPLLAICSWYGQEHNTVMLESFLPAAHPTDRTDMLLSACHMAPSSEASWHEMKAKLHAGCTSVRRCMVECACSLIVIPRLMDTPRRSFWIAELRVNEICFFFAGRNMLVP